MSTKTSKVVAGGGKKKLLKIIKLQIVAGSASPGPPIGPALGSVGVNIMMFCKMFNADTAKQAGQLLPVLIYVYSDKSFTFETKEPPLAKLILDELGLKSGSKVPNREKIGTISHAQALAIVKRKWPDLRVNSEEAALKLLSGTARSMGVLVGE